MLDSEMAHDNVGGRFSFEFALAACLGLRFRTILALMQQFVRLCGRPHKFTYVAKEVMWWPELRAHTGLRKTIVITT